MAINPIPVLLVSTEEHERLDELARQRGFNAADEYVRALVAADAESHGDMPPFEGDDLRTKFKRAFREALRGDFLTEEEFWKEIADDD